MGIGFGGTLLALALPAGAARPTAPRAGPCAAGPSEASVPGLRPMPAAICDYEPAELHRRAISLLTLPRGGHDIEAVERLFALPPTPTMFDEASSANFSILLRSAPGRTPWIALVLVAETFPGRRPHFRGTARPVRIDPRERGEVRLSVELLGVTERFRPGEPTCLPGPQVGAAALRHGWRPSMVVPMVMDAPPPPAFYLERGRLSVSVMFETRDADCVKSLDLVAQPFRRARRPRP